VESDDCVVMTTPSQTPPKLSQSVLVPVLVHLSAIDNLHHTTITHLFARRVQDEFECK